MLAILESSGSGSSEREKEDFPFAPLLLLLRMTAKQNFNWIYSVYNWISGRSAWLNFCSPASANTLKWPTITAAIIGHFFRSDKVYASNCTKRAAPKTKLQQSLFELPIPTAHSHLRLSLLRSPEAHLWSEAEFKLIPIDRSSQLWPATLARDTSNEQPWSFCAPLGAPAPPGGQAARLERFYLLSAHLFLSFFLSLSLVIVY